MTQAYRALARLVWLPWVGVLLLVCALTILTTRVNQGIRDRDACQEHLDQVFAALDTYDRLNDGLPRLDFYPTNAKTDEESLMVALKNYGLTPAACKCPRDPETIREEQGLTYLWNVKLNGKSLRTIPRDTWMLIEISALSRTIKAPHFGKYNILLADGTVIESHDVPETLRLANAN